jgi:hypothetical protein
MINAGTARRKAGSAVKRRRYAGLAIDWASPLIESDRIDALAASARAIEGLRFGSPPTFIRKDVPHLSESLSLESRNEDLSRVQGQKIWTRAGDVIEQAGRAREPNCAPDR